MKSKNRKLLVLYDEEPHGSSLSSPTFITYPIPEPPAPGAAISAASSPPRRLNPPLDSSLTHTFTVLLAALFFLAFFSVFFRRFSDHGNDSSLRHSRRRRGPDSSRPSDELGSRKGTESSAVRSLPVVAYCADATHQIDCAICLAEFEEEEAVKLIPGCRHVFHSVCIDTWLLSHVTCPVCRGTQLFASSESLLMSRSTVQRGDTCTDERVVTTSDLRRTRSCSSGREQEVLIHRTSSY